MSSINFSYHSSFDQQISAEIQQLDLDYFPWPWSGENWKGVGLKDLEYFLSIATIDGNIAGFALFRLNPYEDLSHLLKILVVPSFRGQNLGYKLLEQSYLKLSTLGFHKRYLEVATDNTYAINLYRRLGMNVVNTVRKFYSNGDDAHIMCDPD